VRDWVSHEAVSAVLLLILSFVPNLSLILWFDRRASSANLSGTIPPNYANLVNLQVLYFL
jgi:hypothetical protein